MTIEDQLSDPPTLSGPQYRGEYEAVDADEEDIQDDYRRAELESFLEDGAWADAVGEWAATTGLTEDDLAPVVDHELIEQFDFYWDPSTDDVGYVSPTVSDAGSAALGDVDVDLVEAELDSLGRMVTEVLENDYLLRDDADGGYGFFAEETTDEDSADRL